MTAKLTSLHRIWSVYTATTRCSEGLVDSTQDKRRPPDHFDDAVPVTLQY